MVLAILNGTKTQTRRIVKPKPVDVEYYLHGKVSDRHQGLPCFRDEKGHGWATCGPFKCPYIPKGMYASKGGVLKNSHVDDDSERKSLLWVKETHRAIWSEALDQPHLQYRADGSFREPLTDIEHNQFADILQDDLGKERIPNKDRKWRPSIFTHRWASRIDLEVIKIRVERLQDISEADAWAEGIGEKGKPLAALLNVLIAFPKLNIGQLALSMPKDFAYGDDRKTPTDRERITWVTARGVYAALWEAINGAGSWEANPWVWVIEFKKIKP